MKQLRKLSPIEILFAAVCFCLGMVIGIPLVKAIWWFKDRPRGGPAVRLHQGSYERIWP